MRGRARLLCALLLLLLCVAAHFQGAWCRSGRGGGGGGSGRGGGSGGSGRGGSGRPFAAGGAAGAVGSRHAAGSRRHSAADDPRGRGAWRVSGAAAALAAAALVWWC